MTQRIDEQIHRGYDAGSYANAYETADLKAGLARLSMNRSEVYTASYILGFLSTYELDEMGSAQDAYLEAFESVGQRAKQLGIAVNDPGEQTESEAE